MLELKNVSLVMVDFTDDIDKCLYAYEQTIKQVKFGYYILFVRNNQNGHYISAYKTFNRKYPFVRIFKIDESEIFSGIYEYSRFILKNVASYIPKDISHNLIIQWDGFVLHSEKWNPEFLKYDYIGAPWYFMMPGIYKNVGNGGFSLRSTKLMSFISENIDLIYYNTIKYIQENENITLGVIDFLQSEDNMLCVANKEYLENKGFKFADCELANTFSCESMPYSGSTFGWHGMFYKDLLPEIVKYKD